jgi:hypothetical protein
MANPIAASIAKLSKVQIATFFSNNAPATQKLCDREAERLMDMPVYPASVQGGTSYTVVSDDDTCVVQFRSSRSALDMSFLECVERAYEGFMPRHEFVANVGGLHVYTMGNVGGVSMYLARGELHKNNFRLLRRTLPDFARYVVATNVPQVPSTHVKEFAQLTLPTQVFRLGMAQDTELDAVSRPRHAV